MRSKVMYCILTVATLTACSGRSGDVPAASKQPLTTAMPSAANTPLTLKGLTEYAIPSAPSDITLGPDGNVWFSEGAAGIGRITPTGSISQFAVSVPAYGLASAPDGNLWFTSSSNIGRMTTRGAVSLFPVTLCACTPAPVTQGGITVGPDGDLYFGVRAGSLTRRNLTYALEKMTTSGKATVLYTWKMGGPNSGTIPQPIWLTRGPDNAVWFTNDGPNGYGRITPSGTFTFHWGPDAQELAITAGPDGALWLTDWTSDIFDAGVQDKIVRANTSGTITAEYTIPTPNSFPRQIISGPDGNLWFAEDGNNVSSIGRITPGGVITEFPLAPNRGPYAIINGPNRSIWFTETIGNRIGTFTP